MQYIILVGVVVGVEVEVGVEVGVEVVVVVEMNYFFFGLTLVGIVITLAFVREPNHTPSAETKRACMTYALKDHEKEFAPARWEYLKTLGNPNDVEFWYTSCINHHAYPVGGKENEWVR